MTDLTYERVLGHLARLQLTRLPDCLDGLAEEATKAKWTYVDFLDRLLTAEIAARTERDIAMKTKLARFPFVKTLEQFDFGFQPSVESARSRNWPRCGSSPRPRTCSSWGRPAPARRHLAIALGHPRHQPGRQRLLRHLADLLDQLHKDAKEDRLGHRLQMLCRPKLLILDEMGYFPLDRLAAQFLFQLVSRRYLKASLSSPATRATASGARCSPTRCWPPPSSTGCCTTRRPSTSAARATGCARSSRPASSTT